MRIARHCCTQASIRSTKERRAGWRSLDRGAAGRVVGLVQVEVLLVVGGVWVLDRDGLDRRLK
jgi:hypothetical protein